MSAVNGSGGDGREPEVSMGHLVADVVGRIVRLVAQQGSYLTVVECALVCRMWRDECAKAMREAPLRTLRESFWAFHGIPKLRFVVPFASCPDRHFGSVRWLPGRRFFLTECDGIGTVWSVRGGRVPRIVNRFQFFEYDPQIHLPPKIQMSMAGATGDILVADTDLCLGARDFELRLYSSRSGWRDAMSPALVSSRQMRSQWQFMMPRIDISPDGQKVVLAAVTASNPDGAGVSTLTVTLLDRNLRGRGEKSVSFAHESWQAPHMTAVLDARAELLVVAVSDLDEMLLFAFELTGGPWGEIRPEIVDVTDIVFPAAPPRPPYVRWLRDLNPMAMDTMSRLSSGHLVWALQKDMETMLPQLPPELEYIECWKRYLRRFAVGCDKMGIGIAVQKGHGIFMIGGSEDRPSTVNTLVPEMGAHGFVEEADLSGNWLVTNCTDCIRAYEMRPDYRKLVYLLKANRLGWLDWLPTDPDVLRTQL